MKKIWKDSKHFVYEVPCEQYDSLLQACQEALEDLRDNDYALAEKRLTQAIQQAKG